MLLKTRFLRELRDGYLEDIEEIYNEGVSLGILQKAFSETCKTGRLDVLKKILTWGDGKINQGISYERPFRLACRNGHLNIAQFLVQNRPNLNQSFAKEDAFVSACSNGHLHVAKQLMEWRDGKINISANNNRALEFASYCDHLDVVKQLRTWKEEQGTPYTTKEIEIGYSNACLGGRLDMVKYYLEWEPNVVYSNEAFYDASIFGHLHILEYIFEQNPKLQNKMDIGTPFRNCSLIHIMEFLMFWSPYECINHLDNAELNNQDKQRVFTKLFAGMKIRRWILHRYKN